jgi:hypothetical protein
MYNTWSAHPLAPFLLRKEGGVVERANRLNYF